MTKEEFENLKPGDEVWTHVLSKEQVVCWFFVDRYKSDGLIINRRKCATVGSTVHYTDAFLKEEQATNALVDWAKSGIKSNKLSIKEMTELEAITAEWFNKLASLAQEAPSSPSAKTQRRRSQNWSSKE